MTANTAKIIDFEEQKLQQNFLAFGFVRVPKFVFEDYNLKTGAKLVFAFLSDFQENEIYISQKRLANSLGLSIRAVRDYLQNLQDENYIFEVKDRSRRTNTYRFNNSLFQADYIQVPKIILEASELKTSAKFVLSYLWKYNKEKIFVGQDNLADLLGLNVKTVRASLKELEEKGYIASNLDNEISMVKCYHLARTLSQKEKMKTREFFADTQVKFADIQENFADTTGKICLPDRKNLPIPQVKFADNQYYINNIKLTTSREKEKNLVEVENFSSEVETTAAAFSKSDVFEMFESAGVDEKLTNEIVLKHGNDEAVKRLKFCQNLLAKKNDVANKVGYLCSLLRSDAYDEQHKQEEARRIAETRKEAEREQRKKEYDYRQSDEYCEKNKQSYQNAVDDFLRENADSAFAKEVLSKIHFHA